MFLNVQGLTAGYDDLMVIRNITFSVDSGETLSIIGPNGAGKTTLLWTLSGILKPSSGHVILEGHDITGWDCPRIFKLGVGHVLEGMQVFNTLCVEDNLLLGAYGQRSAFKTAREGRLQTIYEYFPVLEKRRKQIAGSLSGGEKQMLAIGRTLICDLRLLLLDEPSAGLAPLLVKHLFEILHKLRENFHLTVLLVEQNAEVALRFADRGLVLAHGKIMLEGEAQSLMDNEDVKNIYLGSQG